MTDNTIKRKIGSVGDAIVAPSRTLLGGMRLTAKFAVIGFVLIAPLLFVVQRYAASQNASADFSGLEQTGMEYVTPAFALEVALVDARSAAVSGAEIDVEGLRAAMAQVDAVDARIGDQVATSDTWNALSGEIDGLIDSSPADPSEAFVAWSAVVNQSAALVSTAADGTSSR